MPEDDQVPNRYRERLGRALPRAHRQAELVGRAFARVDRAMAAGAWDSPLAQTFYDGCVEAQHSATVSAGGCVHDMELRHRREPALVPRDDRRARPS
ncbi:hypothetical protein J1G42_01695 [Cellulomonas sp. zg-ZUI222]|uniref:hypothetical protein n=1 Tax=Cellulomonas wangleii TaxID=2816956 RepID=UPI001A94B617|nr:hypothetical protein [Cellulomonas wangleii]MBO0919535.1 hypothetical protein [Cellulomonas wangleii]